MLFGLEMEAGLVGSFNELMPPLSHCGRAASQLKVSSQSQPEPRPTKASAKRKVNGSCFFSSAWSFANLGQERRDVGNRGVVRNKVLISSSRANPKIGVYRFDQDFQCIKSSPNARGKEEEDGTGAVTYVR